MVTARANFKTRWETLRASEKKSCPKCQAPSHKTGRVAWVAQQWRCQNGHKWRESPPLTRQHARRQREQGIHKPLCKDGTMAHRWQIAEGPSGYGRCDRCRQTHYFDAVGEGWTEDFRTFRPKPILRQEDRDAKDTEAQ